ncbi:MAG: 2-hydroxychromene-2-carboxylate isomerase [Candidatus Pelagadaptatus aseana]|uniref:2-hydroxychromene-2-carboxylate isomerase n=1 Tax=Candidatus Pelagadaptatus aseana TaxID=3120508 RepID=UPI0039B18941
MSKTLEFYFDVGSPTAYLAHKELPKIASEYNAELVYEPMLLGAVHKATNNIPPGLVPEKGKYMMLQDLPRFVRRYGVPFQMNPFFPVNTLSMMRGCYAAQQMGVFDQYVDAIFDAMWVKGLNMGDESIFKQVLEEKGIDADALIGLIADPAIKDKLKNNTAKAVEKGCFGAPTMFIGEEMYFGQDRLDFIREELAKG